MKRTLALLLSSLIGASAIAFEPAPPLPKGPYRGNLFTLPASVTEAPALQDNLLPKEHMPEKVTAVPPVLNESKAASSQRPLGPLETLTGKLPKPTASLGTPPPLKPIAPITRQVPINVTIDQGKVITQIKTAPKQAKVQSATVSKKPEVANSSKAKKTVAAKPVQPNQTGDTKQKAVVKKAPGLKTLVSQTISEKTVMTSRMIMPNPTISIKPIPKTTIPTLKPVVTFEIGN
jgi:hypothetical protein